MREGGRLYDKTRYEAWLIDDKVLGVWCRTIDYLCIGEGGSRRELYIDVVSGLHT